MAKSYNDDYLKKVFRDKLKDFEYEDEDIEWSSVLAKMHSHSKMSKAASIAALLFLFSILTIQVAVDTNSSLLLPDANKNHVLATQENIEHDHSDSIKLSSAAKDSLITANSSERSVMHQRIRNGQGSGLNKISRHSFLTGYRKNKSSPDKQKPELDKKLLFSGVEDTLNSVVSIEKVHTTITLDHNKNDSAKVRVNPLDSAHAIEMNSSDSGKAVKRKSIDRLLAISIGLFINSNQFTPIGGDGHMIQHFNQDKNIIRNRLGVDVNVCFGSFKLPFVKIKPLLKYMFLHKSYTFENQTMHSEAGDDFITIQENIGYHFVGLGFILQPRIMFLGNQLQIEGTLMKTVGNLDYSFSQRNFQLGAAIMIPIRPKENKVFYVEPFINYTFPQQTGALFSTNMINTGFRVRLFGKED